MMAYAPEDDFSCDEDQLQSPLDKPPQAPEAWIDALADANLKMGVLQKAEECSEEASSTLTARFVHDWRVKDGPDETQ